jgi:hypothetical protein
MFCTSNYNTKSCCSTSSNCSTDSFNSLDFLSDSLSDSSSDCDSVDQNNCFKQKHNKKQKQKKKQNEKKQKENERKLEKEQNDPEYKRRQQKIDQEQSSSEILDEIDFGDISSITKNDPFIQYLVERRNSYRNPNTSAHIAAFVPKSYNTRSCFKDLIGKSRIGENSDKPLYSNNKIKTHAEMDALCKVRRSLNDQKMKKNKMNLIVLRVNKKGELCESAPCYHCTIQLEKNNFVQIDKLYYSRSNGSITCIKFSDWVNEGTSHVSKGWKKLARDNNKYRNILE